MNKSNLYAIFSGKGGVGKTTTLLNIAGVLVNNKKKVLIIDADFYNGGIELMLNKTSKKTIYDYQKNLKNVEIEDYITKYNMYLDFIACPKSIKEAKLINFKTIENLIFDVSLLYDVILIDLNHLYNDLNEKILKYVSNVIYVLTNDPVDLKNSANVIPLLKKNKVNLQVILNYAIHFDREYYSLFDLKSIIQNNIDYIISSRFHNPDFDSTTVRGEIMTITASKLYDYRIFDLIAKSLIKKE